MRKMNSRSLMNRRSVTFGILFVLVFCFSLSVSAQDYQYVPKGDLARADSFLRNADYDNAFKSIDLAIDALKQGKDNQALAEAYSIKAALIIFTQGETDKALSLLSQAIVTNPCGDKKFIDYMDDPRINSLWSAAERKAKWYFDDVIAQTIFLLRSDSSQRAKDSLHPILCYSGNPVITQLNDWIEHASGEQLKHYSDKQRALLSKVVAVEQELQSTAIAESNLDNEVSIPKEFYDVKLEQKKRIGILPFTIPGKASSTILRRSGRVLSFGKYEVDIVNVGDNECFMRNYEINGWSDFVVRKGQVVASSFIDIITGNFVVGKLKSKHADAMKYVMAYGSYDYVVAITVEEEKGIPSAVRLRASLYSSSSPQVPQSNSSKKLNSADEIDDHIEKFIVALFQK